MTDRLGGGFTTLAWVLIPVAVGINVVGGALTNALRIPLFLDVIGTLLLAILAGPLVAAVGGILTNVVLSVVRSPTMLPFALTQAAIALVAGYLAMRGWFLIREKRDYLKLAGVAIAVSAASVLVSWPILVWLFGGITGTAPDVVVAVFLASGFSTELAVLGSQLVMEPVDKGASVVIAYFIAKSVPERYRPSFGQRALARDR
ncbi:ECF transporter S component [Halalkalicoccus sp. NIPERK01]|uniref:ECF transporter S component n=1 Tax=Halalkalicoccus sp. NIPERK01 TaxID=3053469 RepID=UPI00256EBD0B|nr:ECF transporter S component [Halalkalicoccus sp. NIPERK01]MDL5362887.1 ECF transporter S component [Halalkalicoccus sp. NIPERK01]